jgi:hypothetical protein
MADPVELVCRPLGHFGEVTCGYSGYFVAAEPAEGLHAGGIVDPAAGGVGQDDAAWVGGEHPGVGEGDESAEAAAEDDWAGQSECVAEPAQVIGPGWQVPERGAAVVAAAVPALVVEDDLRIVGERGQCLFHVDVIEAWPAVDGDQGRALRDSLPLGKQYRARGVEP